MQGIIEPVLPKDSRPYYTFFL